MTSSFNPFAKLAQNFKAILNDRPKLSNLNQEYPSGYVNFSNRKTRATKLWSYDHIFNVI